MNESSEDPARDDETSDNHPVDVDATVGGVANFGSGLLSGSSPGNASQSSTSLIGCRLGEYQVLRKLGRGGMADVYAAKHLSLSRDVALKVLRKEYSRDEGYVQRFRREARAAAKLNDPHIVQVYDVKSVDDVHFIAQELIDGQNFREYITSLGPLDEPTAIDVLRSVGSALQVAADSGITHRDIKPENIMRSSQGVIKVADFGLARLGPEAGKSHAELTQAGLTLGTPRYMSPEQIQGKAVDSRSDLYSLGVTMYHLLAGRPPFEAEDPLALAVMHLHETPEPLDRARGTVDLSDWLIAIVSRLMNKLPEDRFQSPEEMVEAVRREAADHSGGQIGTGTALATARLQRAAAAAARQRRRKLLGWAAAIGFPVLAAFGGGYVASQSPTRAVADLLNPDDVKRFDTVQQQWLEAVRRHDIEGWQAIAMYFPPEESQLNQYYANKADLQMTRRYMSDGRLDDARRQVQETLTKPTIRGVDRLTAAILDYQIAKQSGQDDAAKRARQRVQDLVQSMKASGQDKLPELQLAFEDKELFEAGINPDNS